MNRTTSAIIIEYNDREMTFSELSRHIYRTRGYHLDSRTLLQRYREGREGEWLVEEQGGKVGYQFPSGVVPVSVPGWGFA